MISVLLRGRHAGGARQKQRIITVGEYEELVEHLLHALSACIPRRTQAHENRRGQDHRSTVIQSPSESGSNNRLRGAPIIGLDPPVRQRAQRCWTARRQVEGGNDQPTRRPIALPIHPTHGRFGRQSNLRVIR